MVRYLALASLLALGEAALTATTYPASGANNHPYENFNILLDFSSDVTVDATKTITLTQSGGVSRTLSCRSSWLSLSDNQAIIFVGSSTGSQQLAAGASTTVTVQDGCFKSKSDSSSFGADKVWSVTTTVAADSSVPVVIASSPSSGTSDVDASTSNIKFVYSKSVQAGSGYIELYQQSVTESSGILLESLNVQDTNLVSFSDGVMTLSPTKSLPASHTLYIQFAREAVIDLNGSFFKGVYGTGTFANCLNGNLDDTCAYSFDTVTNLRTTAPLFPANLATGVQKHSSLVMFFDDHVRCGGQGYRESQVTTSSNVNVQLYASDDLADNAPSATVDNTKAVCIKNVMLLDMSSSSLEDGTTYSVDVSAIDFWGGQSRVTNGNYNWKFTTDTGTVTDSGTTYDDTTPPSIVVSDSSWTTELDATAYPFLEFAFSEKVTAVAGKKITVTADMDGAGAPVEVDVSSTANVNFIVEGHAVRLIAGAGTYVGRPYIINIEEGAFIDSNNNKLAATTLHMTSEMALHPTAAVNIGGQTSGFQGVATSSSFTFIFAGIPLPGSGHLVLTNCGWQVTECEMTNNNYTKQEISAVNVDVMNFVDEKVIANFPEGTLADDTMYHVSFTNDFVQGWTMATQTSYEITTMPTDGDAPQLRRATWKNDGINIEGSTVIVSTAANDIYLEFDEAVQPGYCDSQLPFVEKFAGFRKVGADPAEETYVRPDETSKFVFLGRNVQIKPGVLSDGDYVFTVPQCLITDLAAPGMQQGGLPNRISQPISLNYAISSDNTSPTADVSPNKGSSGNAGLIGAPLTVTWNFNEEIKLASNFEFKIWDLGNDNVYGGTGNNADTLFRTYTTANLGLSVTSDTLSIILEEHLPVAQTYGFEIPNGALTDVVGNPYVDMLQSAAFFYTIADTPPVPTAYMTTGSGTTLASAGANNVNWACPSQAVLVKFDRPIVVSETANVEFRIANALTSFPPAGDNAVLSADRQSLVLYPYRSLGNTGFTDPGEIDIRFTLGSVLDESLVPIPFPTDLSGYEINPDQAQDTLAPEVLLSSPQDGQMDVAGDTDVSFYFSEKVQIASDGDVTLNCMQCADAACTQPMVSGSATSIANADLTLAAHGALTIPANKVARICNPTWTTFPTEQFYKITLKAGSVKDMTPNNFGSDFVFTFRAEGHIAERAKDRVPPEFVSSIPVQNEQYHPIETAAEFIFTENVFPGRGAITIHKSSDNSAVVTWAMPDNTLFPHSEKPRTSADGCSFFLNKITCQSSQQLETNTNYIVKITGEPIRDDMLNPLDMSSWKDIVFASAGTDTTAPLVEMSLPAQVGNMGSAEMLAARVPATHTLKVWLTEAVRMDLTAGAPQVKFCDVDNEVNLGTTTQYAEDCSGVVATVNVKYEGRLCEFSPVSTLEFDRYYTLRMATPGSDTLIKDLYGNRLYRFESTGFRTVLTNPAPTLDTSSDILIAGNRYQFFKLIFSEEVQVGSGGTGIKLKKDGETIFTSFSDTETLTGSYVIIRPSQYPLEPLQEYTIEVPDAAVLDVDGNAFVGPVSGTGALVGYQAITFTTGALHDVARPEILSIGVIKSNVYESEYQATSSVEVGKNIYGLKLYFNEPVEPNGETQFFILESEGNTVSSSSAIWDEKHKGIVTVLFSATTLEFGQTYSITFDEGVVKDVAGNLNGAIARNDASWEVKTMAEPAADNVKPMMSDTNPTDGQTMVPPLSTLFVTFTEPILPDSAGSGSLTLLDCGTGSSCDGAPPPDSSWGSQTFSWAGGNDKGRVAYDPSEPTKVMVVTDALPGGRYFKATLSENFVQDGVGNTLDTDNLFWYFSTAKFPTLESGSLIMDTTPPAVVSTFPRQFDSGLPRSTLLRITFDEPIFIRSGEPYLEVSYYTGTGVPVTTTYNDHSLLAIQEDGKTIEIAFLSDNYLQSGSEYLIKFLESVVRDQAGNYYEGMPDVQPVQLTYPQSDRSATAANSWFFETQPIDTTQPSVLAVSPAGTEFKAPTILFPRIFWTESVRMPTDVLNGLASPKSIRLSNGGTNIDIKVDNSDPNLGTVQVENQMIIVKPYAELSVGTWSVSMDVGTFEDLNGNNIDAMSAQSFVTGDFTTGPSTTTTIDSASAVSDFTLVQDENGVMVRVGGVDSAGSCLGEISTSSDGVTWTVVQTTPEWEARKNPGVAITYDGNIWVSGGESCNSTSPDVDGFADLWFSADNGDTWTKKTLFVSRPIQDKQIVCSDNLHLWDEFPFLAAIKAESEPCAVFGGIFELQCGMFSAETAMIFGHDMCRQYCDLCPEEGTAEWNHGNPFPIRLKNHQLTAVNGWQLLLTGGAQNSAWLSQDGDARTWLEIKNVPYGRRENHKTFAGNNGDVWVVGGTGPNPDGTHGQILVDVWKSSNSGETWTALTARASSEMALRQDFASVRLPDDRLIIAQGINIAGNSKFDEFWVSSPPVADTTAPSVTMQRPLPDAVEIMPNTNIVLWFNEKFVMSTGKNGVIRRFKLVGNGEEQYFDIPISEEPSRTYGGLTWTNTVLTITPSNNLANGQEYSLQTEGIVLLDQSENVWAGLGPNDYKFTITGDNTGPAVVRHFPGAGDVNVNDSPMVIITMEDMATLAPLSGDASKKVTMSPVIPGTGKTVDIACTTDHWHMMDPYVTDSSHSGFTAYLQTTHTLTQGIEYRAEVDEGCLIDAAGQHSQPHSWTFKVRSGEIGTRYIDCDNMCGKLATSGINMPHLSFSNWTDVNIESRKLWADLGYRESLWNAGDHVPDFFKTPWINLTITQQNALMLLVFSGLTQEEIEASYWNPQCDVSQCVAPATQCEDMCMSASTAGMYLQADWSDLTTEQEAAWTAVGYTEVRFNAASLVSSLSQYWSDLGDTATLLAAVGMDEQAWTNRQGSCRIQPWHQCTPPAELSPDASFTLGTVPRSYAYGHGQIVSAGDVELPLDEIKLYFTTGAIRLFEGCSFKIATTDADGNEVILGERSWTSNYNGSIQQWGASARLKLDSNITALLADGNTYTVTLSENFARDAQGRKFNNGLAHSFEFSTRGMIPDIHPPVAVESRPRLGEDLDSDVISFYLVYSEVIKAVDLTNVHLRVANAVSSVATIANHVAAKTVTSDDHSVQVAFEARSLDAFVNSQVELCFSLDGVVALTDQVGNAAAQCVSYGTVSGGDRVAPVLTGQSPAKDTNAFIETVDAYYAASASDLAFSFDNPINGVIKFTFSKHIKAGVGNIKLVGMVSAAKEIDVTTDNGEIIIAENNLLIVPGQLSPGEVYGISMASGVITDLVGNPFAGLTVTEYYFSTTPKMSWRKITTAPLTGLTGLSNINALVESGCFTFGQNSCNSYAVIAGTSTSTVGLNTVHSFATVRVRTGADNSCVEAIEPWQACQFTHTTCDADATRGKDGVVVRTPSLRGGVCSNVNTGLRSSMKGSSLGTTTAPCHCPACFMLPDKQFIFPTSQVNSSIQQPLNMHSEGYLQGILGSAGGTDTNLYCTSGYTPSGPFQCRPYPEEHSPYLAAWYQPYPFCDPNPCLSPPTDPPTGSNNCPDRLEHGESCQLTCIDGYAPKLTPVLGNYSGILPNVSDVEFESSMVPNGNLSADYTCRTGDYSNPQPQCSRLICDPMKNISVANGQLKCSGLQTGDSCTISCNAGYVGYDGSFVCEMTDKVDENGFPIAEYVSYGNIACDPVTCPGNALIRTAAPMASNTTCMDKNYSFGGEPCDVICDPGYGPGGSAQCSYPLSVATEAGFGDWDTTNTVCDPTPCLGAEPTVEHGTVTGCVNATFGTKCMVECDRGYSNRGDADHYLCDVGGVFSKTPTCEPSPCYEAPTFPHVHLGDNCDYLKHGQSCDAICYDGAKPAKTADGASNLVLECGYGEYSKVPFCVNSGDRYEVKSAKAFIMKIEASANVISSWQSNPQVCRNMGGALETMIGCEDSTINNNTKCWADVKTFCFKVEDRRRLQDGLLRFLSTGQEKLGIQFYVIPPKNIEWNEPTGEYANVINKLTSFANNDGIFNQDELKGEFLTSLSNGLFRMGITIGAGELSISTEPMTDTDVIVSEPIPDPGTPFPHAALWLSLFFIFGGAAGVHYGIKWWKAREARIAQEADQKLQIIIHGDPDDPNNTGCGTDLGFGAPKVFNTSSFFGQNLGAPDAVELPTVAERPDTAASAAEPPVEAGFATNSGNPDAGAQSPFQPLEESAEAGAQEGQQIELTSHQPVEPVAVDSQGGVAPPAPPTSLPGPPPDTGQ